VLKRKRVEEFEEKEKHIRHESIMRRLDAQRRGSLTHMASRTSRERGANTVQATLDASSRYSSRAGFIPTLSQRSNICQTIVPESNGISHARLKYSKPRAPLAPIELDKESRNQPGLKGQPSQTDKYYLKS